MQTNWDQLQQRYDALSNQLLDLNLDHKKRQELQREHTQTGMLLSKHRSIKAIEQELAQNQQSLASNTEPELAQLYQEEIDTLQVKLQVALDELQLILFPPDPLDDRSVFVEIRAGTGGQEAALFAADLASMYTKYALNKGWHASVVDVSDTDLGGIREVTLHIEGKGVYGNLRFESGVHRVQRVPKTETAGRIHTSTATVAVLPEAEDVDITISASDLRIDTYRASGAGGQHVNRTDSAVRITHIPTGVVVACQEERSQHKNKAKAMKMLQSRLLSAQREKQEAAISQQRKEMVGGAMRSEKVRTYNFPQNRVTDHQVDVTLKKLDRVMEGDLDDLITPLVQKAREERKHALEKN
jgi:peptide chain release factor 1